MLRYILRRLLLSIPLLVGISLVSFLMMHMAPGGPIGAVTDLNPKATAESRARLQAYYGLDQPLHVQYGRWLARMATLDFGDSFSPDGRPVSEKIRERIPITLTINVLSMTLIFLVAIPVGIYSAVRKGSLFDRISTVTVFTGFAIPTFWLALLLMILFGVKLGWLPISGISSLDYGSLGVAGKLADRARHLILPVLLAAFGGLAGMSRYMRSNMLEVIRQDYVATARAKGLPEGKVIFRHAMRNALLPVITILGLSVPDLLGGSVIFETIFAIPGMGQLFYQGVMSRDYPLIMGILTIGAFLTLLGNLLADVGYALADPRIRQA
ncbi:MAG: ABC-type dipeptide/oligopeptide/nickel transport system, permease component [Deltaproteobacteria bacterium]|jgi:peptide/nickel transport system permease protein|nr:ABC-type dipeptide/oligopeptide/nickel transport system, permease component [Deltaproteobacteria bacterium]